MKFLHDDAKVKDITISGVLLEFFDVPEKVKPVIEQLSSLVGVGHVVCWSGPANLD